MLHFEGFRKHEERGRNDHYLMEHLIFNGTKPFRFNYITFDYGETDWQLKGYSRLRTEVFCEEQRLFEESDQDVLDRSAIPIVAMDQYMGALSNVIGGVRIDEREPGCWWGGRLCVAREYRNHRNFKTRLLFDDHKVNPIFTLSVGSSLIYKAVTTANFLGCKRFYAHVQIQNAKLFQRLCWTPIEEVLLNGHLHVLMEAQLDHYPPSGFAYRLNQAV